MFSRWIKITLSMIPWESHTTSWSVNSLRIITAFYFHVIYISFKWFLVWTVPSAYGKNFLIKYRYLFFPTLSSLHNECHKFCLWFVLNGRKFDLTLLRCCVDVLLLLPKRAASIVTWNNFDSVSDWYTRKSYCIKIKNNGSRPLGPNVFQYN